MKYMINIKININLIQIIERMRCARGRAMKNKLDGKQMKIK